jgi:osmotically-inducible protein OsmY
MAYGNYPQRDMMNQRGRSGYNRRPDRGDWTTDDLGYGDEGYGYGRRGYGDYPLYGGLYAGFNPYGTSDRYRPYGDRERRGERDMWDRAGDEVASWFGDEDAQRRREMDEREDDSHRGRGPKGYMRSDSRINEDVHDRLTDHPRLDASEVTVSVENGEVTLSGFVRRRGDKRIAEDCADGVTGVKNVQNNLRVREQTDM